MCDRLEACGERYECKSLGPCEDAWQAYYDACPYSTEDEPVVVAGCSVGPCGGGNGAGGTSGATGLASAAILAAAAASLWMFL